MSKLHRDTDVTLWVEPAQETALAASAPTPIQQLEMALAAEGYRFYKESVRDDVHQDYKFDPSVGRSVYCWVGIRTFTRSFRSLVDDSEASYTYELSEYRRRDQSILGVSERVTEVTKTGPAIPYRDGLDVGLTSKCGGYYR